ncbi:hypothetical protein SAMN05216241_105139 [Limimonas halophila]|uniref:Uncharacterized protein n=1 Tax=Limimonas halophila TaxID=1082479 RepID=A0A1G7RI63_9PROT|nr:hypothetical protein [Limimonas halophila]SDG10344.1 hypothetical protein SAMN05216241_105139 [Limimonas halophila]
MQDPALKAGSLDATLLARKGAAQPATVNRPATRNTPPPAAVAPAPESGRTSGKRARLTLRLDPVRHRRLRIAAAHLNCSMQALLTESLDDRLAALESVCACLRADSEAPDGQEAAS